MTIATEVNAAQFLSIVAGTPLNNNYPLYNETDVEVVYGSQALLATLNVDFTVQLSEPNYNSFTVTPLAPLLVKINALIATPPTDEAEINYIVVRRKLPNTTSATEEYVRSTTFLSKEIDRIHMKLIQLKEQADRALTVPSSLIGDPLVAYTISSPTEGKAPVWRGTKLVAEIDAADIAGAQGHAEDATAAYVSAQALLVSMNALFDDMETLAATLPLNNYTATTNPTVNDDSADGYSPGSEWINTTTGDRFSCSNASVGAAVWTEVSADLSVLGDMAYEDKTDYVLQTEIPTIKTIPQNSKSTNYTLVLEDAGGHILHPASDGSARTYTIPSNSSVAYPIGTAITFVNGNGAGVVTISISTDVLRFAGDGATGPRTLAANGIATALKIATAEWIISGTGLT